MERSRVIFRKILVDTAGESDSLLRMSMTLPLQGEVDNFLKDFLLKHKDGAFYLTSLTDKVIAFFGVSPEDAALKYDHSHGQTSAETSKIEQLTNWGCVHLLLGGSAKRTGPNEYQHITGPKSVYTSNRLSRKAIGEAMVSVKLLKELGWEPERIMLELHTWPDEVIEAAIRKVFVDIK